MAPIELDLSPIHKILERYASRNGKGCGILGGSLAVTKGEGFKTHYFDAGKARFSDDTAFTKDTVCFIASMTKLVTSVATMQVVERGLIGLDDVLSDMVPSLRNLQVLQSFDDGGNPVLVKSKNPMTLRNLLSHTSGLGYDVFDSALIRWRRAVGRSISSNSFSPESLNIPLKFEPGADWVYGLGLDLCGRVIEELTKQSLENYTQEHIFQPLGMAHTTYRIKEHPELEPLRAEISRRTEPGGSLTKAVSFKPDVTPMDCGGVGLCSTAADYAILLDALLRGGSSILTQQSVDELLTWSIPNPEAAQRHLFGEHHHIFAPDFPANTPATYGLCGAINTVDIPGKRREGSVMWHGMNNGRWWLDRTSRIAATLFVQVLPPGDPIVSELYDELERAVYELLGS